MALSTYARSTRFLAMLLLVLALAPAGWTQGDEGEDPQTAGEGENPVQMQLSRELPASYEAGSTLTVTVTIDAPLSGQITAMGLTEFIPDGWTFNGPGELIRGVMPNVTPSPGTTMQLDFAWITIPQNEFPFVFTYMLDVPASAEGPAAINGFVEYRLTGPAHFSNEAVSQIQGFDRTPPVITLRGEDPIVIPVGTPFSDPGAETDDGSVVTASGQVNTNVAGTYTITYTAKDQAGNSATPVTRTVVVERANTDGNNNGGGTGGGGVRNPQYYGGGGIYMPDEDLVGRTQTGEGNLPEEGAEKPVPGPPGNAQPNSQQPTLPNAGNRQAFSPRDLPQRSVTPIPRGDQPAITPTAPGAQPQPGNREFGKPRLTRDGQEEAKPNGEAPVGETSAPPAPEPVAGEVAAVATENAERPETDPVMMAQADPGEPPAPEAQAAEPDTEAPGFLGGIAAAMGSLSAQERLGLGVVAGIMVIIVVLSLVAYKYAYKPGPRRRRG